jgi:hypothetical protein
MTYSTMEEWFVKNTFSSSSFSDLYQLVNLKEEQGVSISLGLPSLNEEETIGNIIRTIKVALMEEVHLLDEIVLIDSGSTDATRKIAADLGIPVYIHSEIMPQYGTYKGKGEALWKSLYILKGDILAWIDTDIVNIQPHFVYGILGPLLHNSFIQYVKGFYRRPFNIEGDKIADNGGRVTELVARPLINIFFPELSGLIQPLAGEYAGRRQFMERLPFFTGYGVEMGLLIDLLKTTNLNAISQVDLIERIHHHQSLRSLSEMSFDIIQVVIRRLEEQRRIQVMDKVNRTMNLINYISNHPVLELIESHNFERPPIVTLPEYLHRQSLIS